MTRRIAEGPTDLFSANDEFDVHFDLPLVGNLQVDPRDGLLVRANQAFCEMLRYAPGELVGLELAGLVHPDERGKLHSLLESAAQGHLSHFRMKHRLLRSDGEAVWVSLAGAVSRCDSSGRPVRITATAPEIAEREEDHTLQHEHALLSSELHAMESLHQLTIELQQIDEMEVAIQHVLRAVTQWNNTRSASVHFLSKGGDMLELAGACGMAGAFVQEMRSLPADSSIPHGSAVHSRRPVAVGDLRLDRRYAGHAPLAARVGYNAVQCTPLLARDGRPLGVLSVYWLQPRRIDDAALRLMDLYARQISHVVERRQADESLVASETGFRSMFESTAVGMAQIDMQSACFLRVNGTLADMCGYTPDELLGKSVLEVTHPQDAGATREGFGALVSGEISRYQVEKRVVRSSGTPLWVQATMNVVADAKGTPLYVAAILQGISERKQVEHALRASERRFRTMADNTSMMIWIARTDGELEFVNRAYLEFFGLRPGQLKDFDPRPHLHPDDVGEYFSSYARAVGAGAPWQAQIRVCRVDGEWRRLQSRANPIFNDAGDLLSYVGTSADLTDVLDAQAALVEAHTRKDQFLATLAHELRNPLAPLSSSLASLERQPSAPLERPVLERMQRQVNHMVRLVDDMMEVSRITRGTIELRRHPVDMGEVLRHCIDSSRPLIEASGHELQLVSCEPDCWVDGDPVRLAQVFSNLLNNAAKYTDPGGLIALSMRRRDDSVEVTVADSGVGLPPERLEDIFGMFTQLHSASDRSQGGLGIGLTLVRSLVALHGGHVRALSEGPGKGSQFVVVLPALPQAQAHAHAHSEEDHSDSRLAAGARRRILVVDDNRDGADAIAEFLELIGHEVGTAYEGARALELAAANAPRLVLLDLGMPGMDGYETCRRLRALPGGESFRIVALSGWGQAADLARTAASGFDHHLVKPVDLDALADLLDSAGFFEAVSAG